MDISHGEHVEKELDLLITRRHEKRRAEEGERRAEEMWAESERRHDALRRANNAAAWLSATTGTRRSVIGALWLPSSTTTRMRHRS